MAQGDDGRAQSEVIGFVLVFAILVLVFSGYQAFLVPQQNEEVEYAHSQTVQSQLQDVRAGVFRTAATGNSFPATVRLGTTYPDRAIFLNPGPPTGTLRTVSFANDVSIDNAEAIKKETDDFWDGGTETYATKGYEYQPGYNVYSNAPRTIYEGSVLFNRYDGANLTVTNQSIVQGRQITLVMLTGSYSRSGATSATVDPTPVSAPAQTVSVTNGSSNNITVEVPTTLSNKTWGSLLASETCDNNAQSPPTECDSGADGHILDGSISVDEANNILTFELEADVIYDLRMAQVGLGSNVGSASVGYVTEIEGNASGVPEGSTQKLVMEVRDRFNNPVSGKEVFANITSPANNNGTFVETGGHTAEATTNDQGRVTFVYDAPTIDGDFRQEITIDVGLVGTDCTATPTDCTNSTLWVSNSDGSGL